MSSARSTAARVVLISAYDLGRQPFGLASAAAWLERAGFEVVANDLAVDPLDLAALDGAALAAFHLPMHTATRLALQVLPRVRERRPDLPVGFFGLYAAMNAPLLRSRGAAFTLGGEFEASLVRAACRIVENDGSATVELPVVSHERLAFVTPDRSGLPPLERYARLVVGDEERIVGATEASRGCKHLCRHCPVVPVYGGRFRVVPRDVVLEDVARQVEAGARHITFGDPDFWNGIGHARPLVRELHRRFPDVTYDVTIKIEHLLRHAADLAELRDSGCAFVTTAVESVDDRILARLEKGHTRADFERVVRLCRDADLPLHPTFVAFTPWIDLQGYREMLEAIVDLGLIENVAPVQLAIRLLVPAGSRLLELEEIRAQVGPFDPAALVHPWRHADPGMDELQGEVEARVAAAVCRGDSRFAIFQQVWDHVATITDGAPRRLDATALAPARAPIPFLTEPWYC